MTATSIDCASIPLPLIIDCDPGQDDALALMLALASPEALDLRAITTVAGNVPLAKTQRNARIVCEMSGRTDVPVYAGADRPLLRPLTTAEQVHGREGIDGAPIYQPDMPLQDEHAVDYLVRTLRAAEDDSITLAPIGPLTNIAMTLIRAPELAAKIRRIVLMGGAWREGGNVTPTAEFNIYVDPQAADVVFRCGRPIVVMGLDVTHQVITTSKRREAIGALGTPLASAVQAMLEFYNRFDSEKYGRDGGPLHDPCTVAWLLDPSLFGSKHVNVTVETGSELTQGETVVDWWGVTDRAPNAEWVHRVDADRFFALLTERLARL